MSVNGILWYDTLLNVSRYPTAPVPVQNQHTCDPAFAADGHLGWLVSRGDDIRRATAQLVTTVRYKDLYLPLVVRNAP